MHFLHYEKLRSTRTLDLLCMWPVCACSTPGAGRRKCKEASEIHKFSTAIVIFSMIATFIITTVNISSGEEGGSSPFGIPFYQSSLFYIFHFILYFFHHYYNNGGCFIRRGRWELSFWHFFLPIIFGVLVFKTPKYVVKCVALLKKNTRIVKLLICWKRENLK